MKTGFLWEKYEVRNVSFPRKKAHGWVWACVCWLWDYTESSSVLFRKKQRAQRFNMQETKTQGDATWPWRFSSQVAAFCRLWQPPCVVFLPPSLSSSVSCVKCKPLGLCGIWKSVPGIGKAQWLVKEMLLCSIVSDNSRFLETPHLIFLLPSVSLSLPLSLFPPSRSFPFTE